MKLVLMGLIAFIATSCYGQSLRPAKASTLTKESSKASEVVQIMHCLTEVGLNWLGEFPLALEKARTFHVGLRHDRLTYPGKDIVFVAVLESATAGDVFELTHERSGRQEKFNLENNGSFKIGSKEFAWPNEIFGGIWTHEYIETNVRRIIRGPKLWLRPKAAMRPMANVTCTYYGRE